MKQCRGRSITAWCTTHCYPVQKSRLRSKRKRPQWRGCSCERLRRFRLQILAQYVTEHVDMRRKALRVWRQSVSFHACYTSIMSGCSATAQPIQRSILAGMLCILAFLFAFEAKFLWYSPASDTSSQVSAAKALRVDAPAQVFHGAPAPDRIGPHARFWATAIFIALCMVVSESSTKRALSSHSAANLPLYLLSPVDSRPPPAR